MNCLVIAGGKSVNNIQKAKLTKMTEAMFTFGVNDSALKFPCDVVAAIDATWIVANRIALRELDKPIITKNSSALDHIKELDIIFLPEAVSDVARLSGQLAAKISDSLARVMGSTSYVIGIDHNDLGHFYDKGKGVVTSLVSLMSYEALNCASTFNLGGKKSAVECWPKCEGIIHNPSVLMIKKSWITALLRNEIKMLFYRGIA